MSLEKREACEKRKISETIRVKIRKELLLNKKKPCEKRKIGEKTRVKRIEKEVSLE